ncbi:hypothetical protein FBY31_4584 [Arthrobacter sp. SLBN-100]|nr:hypothetical protein FBY31_4584 [Arthrobacter sp. SLBN-100]
MASWRVYVDTGTSAPSTQFLPSGEWRDRQPVVRPVPKALFERKLQMSDNWNEVYDVVIAGSGVGRLTRNEE